MLQKRESELHPYFPYLIWQKLKSWGYHQFGFRDPSSRRFDTYQRVTDRQPADGRTDGHVDHSYATLTCCNKTPRLTFQ